jgi:hypothetical protein
MKKLSMWQAVASAMTQKNCLSQQVYNVKSDRYSPEQALKEPTM